MTERELEDEISRLEKYQREFPLAESLDLARLPSLKRQLEELRVPEMEPDPLIEAISYLKMYAGYLERLHSQRAYSVRECIRRLEK